MNPIEILDAIAVKRAQRSFWAYRQYMNPNLKKGWFPRLVAQALEQFYYDMIAGLRPKLVIEAPPQHGKSTPVIDFISWVAGKNPDWKTIYASFSERLGVRANLKLQKIFDSAKYAKVFPLTQISKSNVVTVSGQFLRNREIIEYKEREGYFRNTTVGGSITGESLDIGIIDDPLKGREQAGSVTIRNKTWDWFIDDFFTRFSEQAGMLAILTRWHIDDPIGRLLIEDPTVKVLKFRAIAEFDEEFRKAGEALFPEHKSIEFLLERKKLMTSASWASLYQQSPIITGGEIIKGAWFIRVKMPPKILFRKIFADTAMKTKEHNDYSVFQCWGMCEDGKIILLDQIRGKWEAPELKRRAIEFWNKHMAVKDKGALRQLVIEDKASGTGLFQDIKSEAKIPVKAIEPQKDKLTRVMDGVPYIESGYVLVLEDSPFLNDYIRECEEFTADDTHSHDDQIDPTMYAINDMCAKRDVHFLTMKI